MKLYFFLSIICGLHFSCVGNGGKQGQQRPLITDSVHEEEVNDSLLLEYAYAQMFELPEIKEMSNLIQKLKTKNTDGSVSLMLSESDKEGYQIDAGDSYSNDRFDRHYSFYFLKRDSSIKIYDYSVDSFISLENWRGKIKLP